MADQAFWQRKTLAQLSEQEWEALCDGCGKCCLHKLQDEETDEIYFTRIACRELDSATGRCGSYAQRFEKVPDCLKITLDEIDTFHWLPPSCAYRRLAEGRGLPAWHPLLTGSSQAMIEAGMSVRGLSVSEDETEDLAEHIVVWPLADD